VKIIYNKIKLWADESIWAKRLFQLFKWVFNGLVIVYLVNEILRIGLEDTLENLPTSIGFYILFLIMYIILPISEYFIYKLSWKISFYSSLKAFILKKIYNKSLIGYSGDVYIAMWANKFLKISKKETFNLVKDNAILSTIGSTSFAFLVLVVFLLFGNIPDLFEFVDYIFYFLVAVVSIVVIFSLLPNRIAKKIFSLSLSVSLKIIFIHFFRLLILGILQIYQWHIVLPEMSIDIWITYITLQVLTTKIPLIPNRDLIFLALGIQLATMFHISEAAITALLVINSILDKLLSALFFLSFSVSSYFKK
jgi:hypothetical protein